MLFVCILSVPFRGAGFLITQFFLLSPLIGGEGRAIPFLVGMLPACPFQFGNL